MALLKRDRPRFRRMVVVSGFGAAAVAGCSLVEALTSGAKPFAFSHRVHVTDESLDCADCHQAAETTDEPGMPALSQCMLCHEEIDAKKAADRQVATLFGEGRYLAQRVSHLEDEVVFSHLQHATKGLDCNVCHVGIEQDEQIVAESAVRMDDCTACHEDRAMSTDCAVCHKEIRSDRAPESHARLWQRRHGGVARSQDHTTANDCTLCHDESSCASCHQETPPGSHNSYFRTRSHGVMARMDRQACATCHRSDSCDSCHRETRPLNHSGSWGGTQSRHCFGCHFPLGKDECSTCHGDTPSHLDAAPLPGNHTPGMNCRMCHGLTAPLPHVDKGDECSRCHR